MAFGGRWPCGFAAAALVPDSELRARGDRESTPANLSRCDNILERRRLVVSALADAGSNRLVPGFSASACANIFISDARFGLILGRGA